MDNERVKFFWKHLGTLRKWIIGACLLMTKANDFVGWLPDTIKSRVSLLVPDFHWYVWIIIALVLVIAFLMEEAYSKHEQTVAGGSKPPSKMLPISVLICIATLWGGNIGLRFLRPNPPVINQPTVTKTSVVSPQPPQPSTPISPIEDHTTKPKWKHPSKLPTSSSTTLSIPQLNSADPAPTKELKCGTGSICNQDSPVQAPQIIHNEKYGTPSEAPAVDWSQSPLSVQKGDPAQMLFPGMDKPGVRVEIVLKGGFYEPEFLVQCSRPCFVSSLETNGQINKIHTENPAVVGVRYISPRQMAAGTVVIIDVRSTYGDAITVMDAIAYIEPL